MFALRLHVLIAGITSASAVFFQNQQAEGVSTLVHPRKFHYAKQHVQIQHTKQHASEKVLSDKKRLSQIGSKAVNKTVSEKFGYRSEKQLSTQHSGKEQLVVLVPDTKQHPSEKVLSVKQRMSQIGSKPVNKTVPKKFGHRSKKQLSTQHAGKEQPLVLLPDTKQHASEKVLSVKQRLNETGSKPANKTGPKKFGHRPKRQLSTQHARKEQLLELLPSLEHRLKLQRSRDRARTQSPSLKSSNSPSLISSNTPSPTPSPTASPTVDLSQLAATVANHDNRLASLESLLGISTGAPSPGGAPSPTDAPTVLAYEDPHLTNILGESFDLWHLGSVQFLRLPFEATQHTADFVLNAFIQNITSDWRLQKCLSPYITSAHFSGRALSKSVKIGVQRPGRVYLSIDGVDQELGSEPIQVGSYDGSPVLIKHPSKAVQVNRKSFERQYCVEVVAGQGRIQVAAGKAHINIIAQNLNSFGKIGGLLGEDDHTEFSKPPKFCPTQKSKEKPRRKEGLRLLSVDSSRVASYSA